MTLQLYPRPILQLRDLLRSPTFPEGLGLSPPLQEALPEA